MRLSLFLVAITGIICILHSHATEAANPAKSCIKGAKSAAKTQVKAAKQNASLQIKTVKGQKKTLLKKIKSTMKAQVTVIKSSASSLSVYCPGLSGKKSKTCTNSFKAAQLIRVKGNASMKTIEAKGWFKWLVAMIKEYKKCQLTQVKSISKCQIGNCLSTEGKSSTIPFDCNILSLGCPPVGGKSTTSASIVSTESVSTPAGIVGIACTTVGTTVSTTATKPSEPSFELNP